jgi:hypothetical protein
MIWSLVFVAIAAIAVVVTTRIALTRARQEADAQAELSQIKEAGAKAAQDKVEIELAKQQERAANAERELLEVKERVKRQRLPRWSFVEPLSTFLRNKPKGSVEIIFVPEDDEALKTAMSLELILGADAKWKILRNARPYSEDDVLPNFLTPAMKENPFHITLFERVGGLSDITVLFSAAEVSEDGQSPRVGTAAEALWRGLHTCGFETIATVNPRLPVGTARIVVGPKR